MENQNNSTTYQRVDFTLPKETVKLLEKSPKEAIEVGWLTKRFVISPRR